MHYIFKGLLIISILLSAVLLTHGMNNIANAIRGTDYPLVAQERAERDLIDETYSEMLQKKKSTPAEKKDLTEP